MNKPEKLDWEHSCEFDCKGCVASGWNQANDKWEKYHKQVIQSVIKEIEVEINSRPHVANIGKRGCVRRLKQIL